MRGFILSFEPIAMDRVFTGISVPLAKVKAALAKYDTAAVQWIRPMGIAEGAHLRWPRGTRSTDLVAGTLS